MRQGLSAVLVVTFLTVLLLFLVAFNLNKPRVLVLHSLDRENYVVKTMDEGLRRVLGGNRQPLSMRWHYLGIGKLPDENHREDAGKIGTRTIEQFDPDLVIAVDDEAQQYVMRRYAGRGRPKVVYAAIDQLPEVYGYVEQANVTGAMEVLPLDAVRETLMQARHGQPARLAVIAAPGATSKGKLMQVQDYDWAPHEVVRVALPTHFAAWKAAIAAMDKDVDAVLVLSYDRLQTDARNSVQVPPAEVVRWTETHAAPLPLGTDVGYTQLGGGLSVAPSALMMGELAAEQALQWLKAAPGEGPPVRTADSTVPEKRYSVAIRESALAERRVTLPSIYLEAARLGYLYYP